MHEERSAWREDGTGDKYEDCPMNKRDDEDKKREGEREYEASSNNKAPASLEIEVGSAHGAKNSEPED